MKLPKNNLPETSCPKDTDPLAPAFLQIQKKLKEGPPGHKYQYRMAPPHRPGPDSSIHPPADARQAAVLILLYESKGELHFPMMRRPPHSGPHSSQISFPGGQKESYDADLATTALRESEEEFGIPADKVQLLGKLSRIYIAPSHFLVYPFVGCLPKRPNFQIDPREVAELLEFQVRDFLSPSCRKKGIRMIREKKRLVPYFQIAGQEIWGASAMILSEFLACLG